MKRILYLASRFGFAALVVGVALVGLAVLQALGVQL